MAEICPSYTESSQTRTHIKTQAKSNARALSILQFAKIEWGPVSDRPWCDSGRPTLNTEACIRRPLFVSALVRAPHRAQARLSSLHDHAHTPASEHTHPCLEDGRSFPLMLMLWVDEMNLTRRRIKFHLQDNHWNQVVSMRTLTLHALGWRAASHMI